MGTRDDELKPLRVLSKQSPYSAKYLGLRATQEELPQSKRQENGSRASERCDSTAASWDVGDCDLGGPSSLGDGQGFKSRPVHFFTERTSSEQ